VVDLIFESIEPHSLERRVVNRSGRVQDYPMSGNNQHKTPFSAAARSGPDVPKVMEDFDDMTVRFREQRAYGPGAVYSN
jgi:hypothetical protein